MDKSATLPAAVTASELDELRTLIEERSAIFFDASRERFFAPRVNEYLRASGEQNAATLLRRIRNSNVEYDRFLGSLADAGNIFLSISGYFSSPRARGSARGPGPQHVAQPARVEDLECGLLDG